MKKIPTLFCRDPATPARVIPEVTPGCEWVLAGEGIATRKFDGTCCLVRGGKLFRRYELRASRRPPPGFELAEPGGSGHGPGWVPVGAGPEDRWHREALERVGSLSDGTYELCGPRIQKNPEGFSAHLLVPHGEKPVLPPPKLTFEGLREGLAGAEMEGIVWHHADGRMAKIKLRDFGHCRAGW